jgi:hypothetical protein
MKDIRRDAPESFAVHADAEQRCASRGAAHAKAQAADRAR